MALGALSRFDESAESVPKHTYTLIAPALTHTRKWYPTTISPSLSRRDWLLSLAAHSEKLRDLVDEIRTQMNDLLGKLRTHGLIAS